MKTPRATVRVSLCINDERGNPTFRLAAADIHDLDGQIDLEPGSFNERDFPVCRVDLRTWKLRIGRRVFPVVGYARHVGNIMWDEVAVTRHNARKVVAHLLARGFSATGYPVGCELLPPGVEP